MKKFTGSGWVLLLWIIFFWPVAIFYFFFNYEKVKDYKPEAPFKRKFLPRFITKYTRKEE